MRRLLHPGVSCHQPPSLHRQDLHFRPEQGFRTGLPARRRASPRYRAQCIASFVSYSYKKDSPIYGFSYTFTTSLPRSTVKAMILSINVDVAVRLHGRKRELTLRRLKPESWATLGRICPDRVAQRQAPVVARLNAGAEGALHRSRLQLFASLEICL